MARYSYDPVIAKFVGSRIAKLREERGLNRSQLAAAVHRSSTTVDRYETGDTTPSMEALLMAARALRCEPAELLPNLAELDDVLRMGGEG